MLKQILSLPTRTAGVAVYVISGFLPVEGQINKKILTLLNNVARQDDTSVEKQLAMRQLTIKKEKSSSCFVHARKTFFKIWSWWYSWTFSEPAWKESMESNCKQILAESHYYSISLLFYIGISEYENLYAWNYSSTSKNQYTLVRLPSKLRLMCGSYVLQTTRSNFNNTQIIPKCLLCGNAEETVEHYILTCEKLEKIRNPIFAYISENYLKLTGKGYILKRKSFATV